MKTTKKQLKKLEKRIGNKLMKEWVVLVKTRDNNRCAICDARAGDSYVNKKGKSLKVILNAHHIVPRENKELKFDIMNGITLCGNKLGHHNFSREISAHGNSFAFMVWLIRNRPEQVSYLIEKTKVYGFDESDRLAEVEFGLSERS